MRIRIFVAVLALLVVASCCLPAVAEAQGHKAQLYYVYDFVVKPAMVSQFEAGVKQEIELGSPAPWSAFSTDEDFHYYFVTPIQNYAAIDSMEKADNEWTAKIGKEKLDALMKSYEGTFEYYKAGVIRFLPDLSYAPKMPGLKPEEGNFMYWAFASIGFGKEKEYRDVSKQWVALYDSNKIPMGWNMFVGVMGVEAPLYIRAERAKSPAQYWAEDEKAWKTIGEARITELWKKTAALGRKFESKTGWARPDLSNKPKAK
jgi:hypothetical protein